jgi:hypothetical protein
MKLRIIQTTKFKPVTEPVTEINVTVNGVPTVIKSNQKVVRSLLSEQQVVIDKNTPPCCDPSTETYWSM